MATHDPLDSFKRRALRHLFEDGSFDLVLGFFTFVIGLATQRGAFLVLAAAYLAGLAVAWKALHIRLTSRRTGYAAPASEPSRFLFGATTMAGVLPLGIVAVSTLATGSLWDLEHWPAWTGVPAGIILAGGSLYAYVACGLGRYAVFAALAVAGSVFFWLYPFGPSINPSDRLTLFLMAFAVVQMGSGAASIGAFIRRHPVVAEEAADGR